MKKEIEGKCKHIRPDGTQCNAYAMSGSDYCYMHNPEISEEEKQKARQKGGLGRPIIANPLPPIKITEPSDLALLLVDVINRVRAGEMDVKVANCLGFLSDKLLKAYEVSKLNDRLEIIERVVLEKRTMV